ncbi:uncharacterized protein LTR77_002767 [Saxophila tyrrhenica]|uniref:DNA endonuclease activator Ctp1 C-terminal domain-containing protein n=1 Tax=Saxophila tyrrhenica TaxID=1690608 RepID=A0AAV9PG04_9PEZI|nr:hypothetical protein LTR77_002767 [Saxophila tyrrhenica]
MATPTPNGFVPEAKYQRLVRKHNDLSAGYKALEVKFEALETKYKTDVEAARAEHRKTNERLHQWKAWIEHHKSKIWPEQGPVANAESRTPSTSVADEAKQSSHHIPSSQTTIDDTIEAPAEQEHPSSDGVEVVSARPVKRRRGNAKPSMPPPVRVKEEPNSPENPIEFGSQDYSSPHVQRKRPLLRTETSDLDAVTSRIVTPRRRRHNRATSVEQSRPAAMVPTMSSLSEGNEIDTAFPDMLAGDRRQLTGDREHDLPQQAPNQAPNTNALRQLSNNVPYGAEPRMNVKRKRGQRGDVRERDIGLLSEDGEIASQTAAVNSKNASRPELNRRLDTLLDGPTPERAPLLPRPTPQTVIRRPDNKRLRPIAQPEDDPATSPERPPSATKRAPQRYKAPMRATAEDEPLRSRPPRTLRPEDQYTTPNQQRQEGKSRSPVKRPVYNKRPRGLEKSPPPPEPEEEPLRARPLDSLHLDDFKINPKYLGSDFAFSDTLRGREQRRCLQGCTRPDCCGNAFRTAIEMGAIKSSKSDSQVLEDYLGPDWDQIMGSFGPEKRKSMLTDAQTWSFANQHGKHKTAFERARSPPGFWRTDMPTTQEAEEDRSRAHEMERQKVEERWREALRPGGRWLFRDERPPV